MLLIWSLFILWFVVDDILLFFIIPDNGLKTRLEMIKNHAISVLQELKVIRSAISISRKAVGGISVLAGVT